MANNANGTCPLGGTFYACLEPSGFVGCCTSNPCQNGCPASNFLAAGTAPGDVHFSTNDIYCPESQFWTCSGQTPTFQGCCKYNACNGSGSLGGCPLNQLSTMTLTMVNLAASTTQAAAPTTTIASSSQIAASGTTIGSSDTGSTTYIIHTLATKPTYSASSALSPTVIQNFSPSGTADSMSSNQASTSSPSLNIPAIAGGASGCALVLIIIALALVWKCHKRKRRHVPGSFQPMQSSRNHDSGRPANRILLLHSKAGNCEVVADANGISPPINDNLNDFHDTKFPETPESIISPQISPVSIQGHFQPTSLSSICRSELIHELSSEHVPSIKSQERPHIPRSNISNYSAELDVINGYSVPELSGSPVIKQQGRFT